MGIDWSFLVFAGCSGLAVLDGIRWTPETKDLEIGEFNTAGEVANSVEAAQQGLVPEDNRSGDPKESLTDAATV
jgi:hypothetical protein